LEETQTETSREQRREFKKARLVANCPLITHRGGEATKSIEGWPLQKGGEKKGKGLFTGCADQVHCPAGMIMIKAQGLTLSRGRGQTAKS